MLSIIDNEGDKHCLLFHFDRTFKYDCYLILISTDFVNDNEGDGVASDPNKSDDWKQDSLQDPSYHQKLLFPNVPQRIFCSVLHSGILEDVLFEVAMIAIVAHPIFIFNVQ